MAEQAKPPFSPGSGLCTGFTISEAILSDALTLVRGDRFYAHEYGPQSLNSFGFKAASSDFDVASGGVMYKLLMRAFPGWHRNNSVYALYPFSIPSKTKEVFSSGAAKPPQPISYDPPAFIAPPVPVTSWQGCVQVLQDQARFKVPCKFISGLHKYQINMLTVMQGGLTLPSLLGVTTCSAATSPPTQPRENLSRRRCTDPRTPWQRSETFMKRRPPSSSRRTHASSAAPIRSTLFKSKYSATLFDYFS